MSVESLLRQEISASSATVISGDKASKLYGQTTYSEAIHLDAAIVVRQRSALHKLVELANAHQFVVHPVSSNNNWGYGSVPPNGFNQPVVLLDLSQLKKITLDDKELGLVTLEPGVTQQDLSEFIEANNLPYMVPVTGAGPNCSIVSNALERGYGITPHTDHFYACTALKAIIPHPDLCDQEYRSVIDEWDNSSEKFVDKSFKWGIGPYLDGIFTQSNFGIVTEMTFRLALKPEYFSAFYIQIPSHSRFADAVYFIRKTLQIYSGMVGSINLMDRRRLLSMTVDNPNLSKSQGTFLSEQQVAELAKQKRLPEWMIVGSIYGTKATVRAVKRELKRNAKGLGTMLCSDDWLLSVANRLRTLPLNFIPLFSDINKQLDSLNEGIEIMLGKPNKVALPLPYWRNQSVKPNKSNTLNPAHDSCGLLWYAPLVKMHPTVLNEFVTFVRTTIQHHDLDPFITFTNLRHDCIDATVPIVFDQSSETERARAMACLESLVIEGRKQGFVPYRLPVTLHHELFSDSPFWSITKMIKRSVDPNNILTPGKYCPAE